MTLNIFRGRAAGLKQRFPPAENEMNGMTQKELEQEKLTVERMCLELKAKRQVSSCSSRRPRPLAGASKTSK